MLPADTEEKHAGREADPVPVTINWIQGPDLQTISSEMITTTSMKGPVSNRSDDPLLDFRVAHALFILGFMQWEKDERDEMIYRFLQADSTESSHRKSIFNEFQRHARAQTVWTTREGVEAASTWIEAFRFWDAPELKIVRSDVTLRHADLSVFHQFKNDA